MSLPWKSIQTISEVHEAWENSFTKPVFLFKHSTRCSISLMALNRIERKWDRNEEKISPFFLDLIAFREVSHFIAQHSGVQHESPQVIVVKNGEVVHHASHNGISLEEIMESIG